MTTRVTTILVAALFLNLGLSIYLLATRDRSPDPAAAQAKPAGKSPQLRQLQNSLNSLRSEVELLNDALAPAPTVGGGEAGSETPRNNVTTTLGERLARLESSVGKLQASMDGISIEGASEDRAKLFASEGGHLKADEYFEAGKFAIAGEGYLKFLEAFPDHPDHRSILQRARKAFGRAGYGDKALFLQSELLRIYPEHRGEDLMTLANLEKANGRFADAAKHAAESAELYTSDRRYWNLLYAAWYTELAQGPEAGLAYTREVERQINQAGYGDQRLGARAREKIEELERALSNANKLQKSATAATDKSR